MVFLRGRFAFPHKNMTGHFPPKPDFPEFFQRGGNFQSANPTG